METHIDWRFGWHKLETFQYLQLNLLKSSLEEKIAALYRISHFSNLLANEHEKKLLLISYDSIYEDDSLLRHLIDYLTNQGAFDLVIFYGSKTQLLVAVEKIINNQGKTEVKLFQSKKEALRYILKSKQHRQKVSIKKSN